MLDVQNLSIATLDINNSTQLVNNLNFKIESGEILAIIGESGSGKTMTALSIMRLLPKNLGFHIDSKIILHGSDLLTISECGMQKIRGADVAMIFQDPMTSLNPIYTAGQQIIEVLKIHRGLHGRYAALEAMRLLEIVCIPDPVKSFGKYPYELSGGMQQRVMIAMALACRPSLLIADEPTTALDVTTQENILELLRDLQKQYNMGMLLITHNLEVAANIADRIAVMQNGVMLEQDKIGSFFKDPRCDYSRKLLNSTPQNLILTSNINANKDNIPVLTVNNLNVKYKVRKGILRRNIDFMQAVSDVNFELYQGKTTAIVGESGSGKSTIAKSILGLTPAYGSVKLDNVELLDLSTKQWIEFRKQIQIVFQDPYSSLDPKLSILDSLQEGLKLQGNISREEINNKIDDLLIQVGLPAEYKFRYPHQLSGGQLQRICIARALGMNPKIIIFDEPTSSLDVSIQAQILELLIKLQNKYNLTYLFITHDLNLVRLLAQYVLVLRFGKVVESGDTVEIFSNPKEQYTRSLLDAMPKISKF